MQARLHQILHSGGPFELLTYASEILELATERPADRLRRDRGETFSVDQFIESMTVIDLPESTALLAAIQALVGVSPAADRAGRVVAARTWPLPDWVRRIGEIEVVSTAQMLDVLRDGDNILVMVRTPLGTTLTAMVYIDHNMGTVVKDGFVAPVDIEKLGEVLDESGETGIRFDFLDPADARARIEQAIAEGERIFPPLETDAWPRFRPFIEWIVRRLPEGGEGYVRPVWSDPDRRSLVDDFLAAYPALTRESDEANIVRTLIDFACDYGAGDPLRWSPVSVEIFLADWFPRKVIADQEYRDRVPDAMMLFIRYCHEVREIPAHLTRETLDAVWRWHSHVTERDDGFDPDAPFEAVMLDVIADHVGGPDALDRLDATPAPVEEFDWTGIPIDVHDKVAEVLSLTDRCCEEVFDLEFRTLVRRLIARAAVGDPNLFRRKAKVENTAVAFVWMIASENQVFRGDFTVKQLRSWFGLGQGSSSQRAETIRKALGFSDPYFDRRLADPTLLHSSFRGSLVERRDRYLAELARLAEMEPPPELPVDYTAPMAIAWFPADEWPEARTRLSLTDMPRSHAEYSREIETILREHAAHTVGHLAVAPIALADLETLAMSRGIHPTSDHARALLAAEMHALGDTIPWPPGRNQPCWCGSGRKYKHCCGRPG